MAGLESGIPFATVAPQIPTDALAGLRPLTFGAPMQFQAMPAFQVAETKPYIAQGIDRALSAIGAGITASYQQKRQDKKDAFLAEREAAREELANKKLLADEAKLKEQQRKDDLRHSEVMATLQAKSSGKGSKDISQLSQVVRGTLQGTQPVAEQEATGAETPGLKTARRMAQERVAQQGDQLPSEPSGPADMGLFNSAAPALAVDRESPISISSIAPKKVAFDFNKPAALSLALPVYPTAQMPEVPLGSDVSRAITPQQQTAVLASLPQYGAPDFAAPIEPKRTEGQRIGALVKQPEIQPETKQPTPARMDRVFYVDKSGEGGVYDSNVIEEFMKKFNETNPEWRAVGADSTKEGYKINYVNIKEEADKAALDERKLSDNEKQKVQQATRSEGQAIVTHPAFKNYEGQNGTRAMMRSFMAAYDNVKRNPSAAGAADVDLINTFARATSGGRITEGEVKLMIEAKNFVDKLNLIKDKPLSGALLSDRQRDQMMRTMAEMHNEQAAAANDVLLQGREKMMDSGQKNEVHLPHPYVDNIILVTDAAKKISENDAATKKLLQEAKKALAENDTESLALIKEQLNEISQESESLSTRLKRERYTGSLILGKKDFSTKRQGFVGGGVGFPTGQEANTAPAQ
jgi:hypothetical protein